jgi:hypothetical protein
MNNIINLTQHAPSAEQTAAGVFNSPQWEVVKVLSTFEEMPTYSRCVFWAREIAQIAKASGATSAMIGGAPFFMRHLEDALHMQGIAALYAFSVRESTEQAQPDGSVRKVNVFKHVGFYPAAMPRIEYDLAHEGE